MDYEGLDKLTRMIVGNGTSSAATAYPTVEQLRELDASIAECLMALDEEPPWEPVNDSPLDEPNHRSR